MCVTCVLCYVQTLCCYVYKQRVTVGIRADIYVELLEVEVALCCCVNKQFMLPCVQTGCCCMYKQCVPVRIRSDIYVEVEAAVGSINGTDGIFVAARVEHGGCSTFSAQGLFFFLFPKMQTYIVAYDLGKSETALLLGSGEFKLETH